MKTSTGLGIKIGLVCFGLLLGVVGFEIGLRIIDKPKAGTEFEDIEDLRRAMLSPAQGKESHRSTTLRDIISPNDDDKIIYELKPNLSVKFQRAQVATNSCGMRGPEVTVTKPANVKRVAILGDSFTFGWGVEQKETFAQVLEDNLNRNSSDGTHIQVLNFGVPGYSTFQEVYQFLERGADFQPDAILVFFVQNDFGPPFFIRHLHGGGGIVASSEVARLASRLLSPGEPEQSLVKDGLDPNSSLRVLADWAQDHGVPLFLTINPRSSWSRDFKKLWILKARHDIRFLRLREDFMRIVNYRKIPVPDLTLSFDPHPSPLRHQIYGDILTPYFMDTIR